MSTDDRTSDGYLIVDTGGSVAYTHHLCPAWRDSDDGGHYMPALCGNTHTTQGFPSGRFRTACNDIATDVELPTVLASDHVCRKCADRLAQSQQMGPGLLDLLDGGDAA